MHVLLLSIYKVVAPQPDWHGRFPCSAPTAVHQPQHKRECQAYTQLQGSVIQCEICSSQFCIPATKGQNSCDIPQHLAYCLHHSRGERAAHVYAKVQSNHCRKLTTLPCTAEMPTISTFGAASANSKAAQTKLKVSRGQESGRACSSQA